MLAQGFRASFKMNVTFFFFPIVYGFSPIKSYNFRFGLD